MIKTILILILIGSGNLFASPHYSLKCEIEVKNKHLPDKVYMQIFDFKTYLVVQGSILPCDDIGSYIEESTFLMCESEQANYNAFDVLLFHSLEEIFLNRRKYKCERLK